MEFARKHRSLIYAILVSIILVVLVFVWLYKEAVDSMESQADNIRDTVYKRAMQCYVIEGVYPESLDYLVENYGLVLNTDDYRVVYIPTAENIPPEIKVMDLKNR